MNRSVRWSMLLLVPMIMLGLSSVSADPGHGHKPDDPKPGKGPKANLQARLSGRQEVPFVVTDGEGTLEATLNDAGDQLSYTLSYSGLNGNVTQAHIHVGQRFVAAGISVFLCTNLGNSAGTQACPSAPAQISGTITAANVVGPLAQGVGPGDLVDLLEAIRSGQAYVNVHTDLSPGGEIRGQLHFHPPGNGGED